MSLVAEKQTAVFDLAQIRRGDLLYGRHCTWDKGKSGFVTSATENQLTVQYFPGIGNVTNHFIIYISEVVNGEWEIRWSANMKEIYEYGIKTEEKEPEAEGGGDNVAGRTDI